MLEFIFRVMAWHESREQDRGATAVEYALILFAVVGVVAAVVFVIGNRADGLFTAACNALGATGC